METKLPLTVECEGSGHLTVRRANQVIREIQAGPSADAWMEDHDLEWDDVDHGRPVEIERE